MLGPQNVPLWTQEKRWNLASRLGMAASLPPSHVLTIGAAGWVSSGASPSVPVELELAPGVERSGKGRTEFMHTTGAGPLLASLDVPPRGLLVVCANFPGVLPEIDTQPRGAVSRNADAGSAERGHPPFSASNLDNGWFEK